MTGAQVLDWANSGGYVVGAWAISAVTLVAYVGSILRRGRRLSQQVPPDQRRWM